MAQATTPDRVLAFLRDPASHGVQPGELTWAETHLSWLFATPTEVLKLKKPVRHPPVDHRTLARRERDGRAELQWNQRLAPGVYLGLSAVVRGSSGLRLVPETALAPGEGVVEWLVRMRRLPEAVRLDRRIAHHSLDSADVQALGRRLAGFYRAAPSLPLRAADWLAFHRRELRLHRAWLLDPRWASEVAAQALGQHEAALATLARDLGARAADGCIVEGHGDLRPDHVFLLDPPVVIDCLEFDRRLLRVDPYEEVAGLGLDCGIAGAPWVGLALHQQLVAGLGREPSLALMRLYMASRALLRARLAIAHLGDPDLRRAPWWLALAERYLLCALRAGPCAGPHGWP